MEKEFNDTLYKEVYSDGFKKMNKSIIKAADVEVRGFKKISVDEESHTGVKIILEKDENDNIKEIKFHCSCGQTKSVVLDYSDQ